MQARIINQSSNVNHPQFFQILDRYTGHERVFAPHCEDLFSLFVRAGLTIEAIPQERLRPEILMKLLDAGIFVNHPRILDELSKGYRYDLALILFLYGYTSRQITSQLERNAFIDFKRLKKHSITTQGRSQFCRQMLQFMGDKFKINPNLLISDVCQAIHGASKALETHRRAEAARIAADEAEQRNNAGR
jgi:hypothetical protein